MSGGIEHTNLIGAMLGKPDFPFLIDRDIPRQRIGRGHLPFMKRLVARIIHLKRITHGSGEPEPALLIKGQEKRLAIVSGKLDSLYPVLRSSIFLNFPGRIVLIARGVRVAARPRYPEIALAIECGSPRVAAIIDIKISRRHTGWRARVDETLVYRQKHQRHSYEQHKKGTKGPENFCLSKHDKKTPSIPEEHSFQRREAII